MADQQLEDDILRRKFEQMQAKRQTKIDVQDLSEKRKFEKAQERKQIRESISPLETALTGFADSATFGLSDELASFAQSPFDSELRQMILDRTRERQALGKEQNPKANIFGQLSAVLGGGATGVVKQAIPRALTWAASGAARGYGENEDPDSVLRDTLTGAAVGLTTGPVANFSGDVTSKVVRGVGRFINESGSKLIKRAASAFGPEAEKMIRDFGLRFVRRTSKSQDPVDIAALNQQYVADLEQKIIDKWGAPAIRIAQGEEKRTADIALDLAHKASGANAYDQQSRALLKAIEDNAPLSAKAIRGGKAAYGYLSSPGGNLFTPQLPYAAQDQLKESGSDALQTAQRWFGNRVNNYDQGQ